MSKQMRHTIKQMQKRPTSPPKQMPKQQDVPTTQEQDVQMPPLANPAQATL